MPDQEKTERVEETTSVESSTVVPEKIVPTTTESTEKVEHKATTTEKVEDK